MSQFLILKATPWDSLALPPEGLLMTFLQLRHYTEVWAWLNTTVMFPQPLHFTSIKYELGAGIRRFSL